MAAVTARTASSNASWLAVDGFVVPLTFRTYCSAADSISSTVAGGSKLWSTRMFLHMTSTMPRQFLLPLPEVAHFREQPSSRCP